MLKKKQLKRETLVAFTRSFTQLLSLSCIYTIEQRILANEPQIIDDINQH